MRAGSPRQRREEAGVTCHRSTGSPYNRTEDAKALLAEIEAWCARTGCLETLPGRVLYRHPGFAGLLRKRLTVSVEKEAQVREFLKANPNGWSGELPKTHGFGVTRQRVRSIFNGDAPEPSKTPSERCLRVLRDGMEDAVRKLDGLERFKLPDGVAEACKLDGRPYTEFLSALVWMGLECWKDDRAASKVRRH